MSSNGSNSCSTPSGQRSTPCWKSSPIRLIAYFKMQIRAGADAIQIFDSWGGIIAGHDYEAASLQWIRRIVAALPRELPGDSLRERHGATPCSHKPQPGSPF